MPRRHGDPGIRIEVGPRNKDTGCLKLKAVEWTKCRDIELVGRFEGNEISLGKSFLQESKRGGLYESDLDGDVTIDQEDTNSISFSCRLFEDTPAANHDSCCSNTLGD